jgi:hypothetical protein
MAVVVLAINFRMSTARASAQGNTRKTCTRAGAFLALLIGSTFVLMSPALLVSQPPPPRQDPKSFERRIGEIRNRLTIDSPANAEQRELASFVERYLDQAARELRAGQRFQAERLTDAADACRRPIEHLQHIASSNQPRLPLPYAPGDSQDRMRQVYFRLRLSDFFLQQIPPPAPRRLLDMARHFYEQAVKAQQEGKGGIVDEYTKAADDLTHALESLAQASISRS